MPLEKLNELINWLESQIDLCDQLYNAEHKSEYIRAHYWSLENEYRRILSKLNELKG